MTHVMTQGLIGHPVLYLQEFRFLIFQNCQCCKIVSNHGIPDENIVVMMFDDIANSEENPIPGKIFNRPHGPDVYAGVPKDYTGTSF